MTVRVPFFPRTWIDTFSPGLRRAICLGRSCATAIGVPSTPTMTSPGSRPARAAGLAGSTSLTSAPEGCGKPSALARPASTGWIRDAERPRWTLTVATSCGSTSFSASIGIAKPIPLPGRVDRGVDADHLPAEVEERTAAVARVDRRVRLDEVVVRTGAELAPLGADDPHRDGVTEAEGIADRDDVLADAHGIVQPERDELTGPSPPDREHGGIEPFVHAPHRRRQLAPVRELHANRGRARDDVRVGRTWPALSTMNPVPSARRFTA